jgi:hypothetical protein
MSRPADPKAPDDREAERRRVMEARADDLAMRGHDLDADRLRGETIRRRPAELDEIPGMTDD